MQHPFLMLSYPRSGNHAFRTVIEYVAKRPTAMRLPGTLPKPSSSDFGIAYSKANSTNAIKIVNEEPVAFGSHFVDGVTQWEKRLNHGKKMPCVLIIRDPIRAINSHVQRELKRRIVNSKTRKRTLVEEHG
jgi:hypothetical protein